MTGDKDLIRWSEALAGLARTGLAFTENLFERERYEEVLNIAADIQSHLSGADDPEEKIDEWMQSVGKGISGYVTPKLTVGAVVGNEDQELLLIQRADSGVWLFPTGFADVGYSAAEIAEKEVLEETGMEVQALRIISILDGIRGGFTRMPLYSIIFQCKVIGGTLKPHPLECLDVGFFAQDALPEPLAGSGNWVNQAFAAIRGEPIEIQFDEPRRPAWKSEDT
ncbi:MAG: NUDIX hydrolase N-terminal domain-containing protein [Actinomycetota bacterium]|nr:NUDIX hydrolase N-terminal domain-containing protein [Actinomycetota bacterium]